MEANEKLRKDENTSTQQKGYQIQINGAKPEIFCVKKRDKTLTKPRPLNTKMKVNELKNIVAEETKIPLFVANLFPHPTSQSKFLGNIIGRQLERR